MRDICAILDRAGILPSDIPRAFEFGCGVGRVTPFLAETFRQVTAADVSNSHLTLAREQTRGAPNVVFTLAENAEFGMSETFDFWFSKIVLQHNPPPVIAMILSRALSLLAPGGVAIFQVPTYALGYRFCLHDYMAKLPDRGEIEMHVLPQPVVFNIARSAGCEVLEVLNDGAAGNPRAWTSNTFVLRKSDDRADRERGWPEGAAAWNGDAAVAQRLVG
jgi:SAM-dependent methyltransferase